MENEIEQFDIHSTWRKFFPNVLNVINLSINMKRWKKIYISLILSKCSERTEILRKMLPRSEYIRCFVYFAKISPHELYEILSHMHHPASMALMRRNGIQGISSTHIQWTQYDRSWELAKKMNLV